jgi:hypothetical protein
MTNTEALTITLIVGNLGNADMHDTDEQSDIYVRYPGMYSILSP